MNLDDIIKALQDLNTGGGGGDAKRKEAIRQAEAALKIQRDKNKLDSESLKKTEKALLQARDILKGDREKIDLIDREIKSTREQIKANDEYVETIRKVGSSFVGLGKAALRGSGSISDFTDNIFGLQTVGRSLDTNIETFRQLSNIGANFGQSIVELRTAAATATLPLDDFAKLVGENSTALAALFGSATQGAKRIADLGRETRRLGIDRLAPLGFTVDEINETLLLNLENQRRAGVLDSLSTSERISSSIAFAEQLDRLAKLTGQQRDELRKNIEQQQSNERFQAFLQGQTAETGNRLRAFASTVEGISPALAEGFQDLIANAGVPVTESALQLVQNIPGARAVINDLISGAVSSEEALVRLRDISASSVDRFRSATVTGQVEFLRLQGGIIELGRRVTDTGAVLDEQAKSGTALVQGLTTFEQATKVLSSQFQQIETGLLQAFGPALGGIIGGVQGLFAKGGVIATALAKAPAATAGLFAAALTGKFLFDKAAQIGIITAGTAGGIKLAGPLGGAGGFGKFAKGGLGLAGKGIGAVGGLALGAGGVAQAAGAETTGEKALGIGQAALGGALTGATIGSLIPVIGTAVGGAIGAALGGGSALLASMGEPRQFGGGMDTGRAYLTGEAGPELVSPDRASAVTANNDLQKIFNTASLEKKMENTVRELETANKTLTNLLTGVNTGVAINARSGSALEKIARGNVDTVGNRT